MLTVSEDPIRLIRDEPRPLALSLGQRFTVIKRDGDFKVRTLAYAYRLSNDDSAELVSFHWHPPPLGLGPDVGPHLHVKGAGLSSHNHIPTGRVSVESVLRMALRELHVRPLRDDWSAVLHEVEQPFLRRRTWA